MLCADVMRVTDLKTGRSILDYPSVPTLSLCALKSRELPPAGVRERQQAEKSERWESREELNPSLLKGMTWKSGEEVLDASGSKEQPRLMANRKPEHSPYNLKDLNLANKPVELRHRFSPGALRKEGSLAST